MKEVIKVRGGRRLAGTVKVEGAKNSALKLMAATVIGAGCSTIENVPDIADVDIMAQVLTTLGAKVERGDHKLIIDTSALDSYETPYELVAKMRASISILGPLIARYGCAKVAMPGGCQIGSRKLDMHIAGLESLGVQFETSHGFIHASTPNGLHGADFMLEFPSVGATENLMMAGIAAKGETIIDNAAREPEIVDLANMLNAMGACVEGAGSPTIHIEGRNDFHPCVHRTVGDRIEAGTFLVAGALCGDGVTVLGADPKHLNLPIRKLRQMGCEVETGDDGAITIKRHGEIIPADIQTLPFPGFPTDLQAQFMALSAIANGASVITENVFENRFMFASELTRMGADIRLEGHHALIQGVRQLSGAPVASPDLRGGAALVLAGLVAEGETVVSAIEHIDRGYERYVQKLAALGADIERCPAL
ncbi:MAG: UDP-N-acetylglucosamine 1-carboxyvinyltransferase [Coriobacteriales bacterium]|nr:UDP-N-acetylglucosamine 1-carboxyvinyltransferase [Coriobacteriales bacterium]MBQ6586921.1 UDP-N-acetylglucosamine 1-carboxyvinyltransferase [Coriobacteriales bacterium]